MVCKKSSNTAWKVPVFGIFLVRMRENTDQKNSKYGHFSQSENQTRKESVLKVFKVYIWIFFLNLGLKQALFYVNKLLSWIIPEVSLIISAMSLQRERFSRLKVSIIHLSINYATFESLFSSLVFRNEFAIFLFLSAISEKQESPVSKGLKFKNSKNYLARKSFIDKVIFDRFFVL